MLAVFNKTEKNSKETYTIMHLWVVRMEEKMSLFLTA